jgi:SAM-dependent methyltransferase
MDEQFATDYEDFERWHWWFQGRRQILAAIVQRELTRQAASGPRRLVSLGCGPAAGLDWLAEAVGAEARVIGVDADPSGALRGQGGAPRPARVSFAYGRAEATPLRSASCDAVLALDLIEHMDDDAAGLAEAARLVRPGGFLLVTVPAFQSLWGNQDVVSHHRRRYTARSLSAAFARAGLEPSWLSYFNTLLFPAVAAVRWGRRLVGRADAEVSDFDSGRPGTLNDGLTWLFAAERHLMGKVRLPFGVSLAAVARPQLH